jgi:NH3-dependent NAD+ synthetase
MRLCRPSDIRQGKIGSKRKSNVKIALGQLDPRAVVDKVLRLVRMSEYKRRQLPPGLKITGKAFGTGRRYPVAQAFRG